jgi:diaminopimelate epimerase
MLVNFTKMQGLGNDFVVIDLITQGLKLESQEIKRIADRHFGIGCDQVILIEPPIYKDSEFFYRIFNANGQEVEQCGNGARAAAKFFYESGFVTQPHFKADCLAGSIEFQMEENEAITVNLGFPEFEPEKIPFTVEARKELYPFTIDHTTLDMFVLSIGNPHAIIVLSSLEQLPLQTWGEALSKDPRFPKETNVEFIKIIDPQNIQLRVFERGVGETLSCGSGAAAAVIAAKELKLVDSRVSVHMHAGKLEVFWENPKSPVFLTGPAVSVFLGRFRL